MDARREAAGRTTTIADEALTLAEAITAKRDRLLASLTLIAGIGFLVGLPFALRAGAEFFMPVTAALVVAIALVPLLEWFERRGFPSKAAAGLCVVIFLFLALFAIGSIVVPASDWVAQVPSKIPKVRAALEPVIQLYKHLDRFIDRTTTQIAISPAQPTHTVSDRAAAFDARACSTSSAPHLLIQLFFALLVIFFFLAGWTAMRKKTIVSRGSFEGALTTARVIQQVVDATSTYLGTITLINIGLGALTAGVLWLLGMPSPVMWGGIVAVANYIPYLGPIVCALLLFVGGLMTYPGYLGRDASAGGIHQLPSDRSQFLHPDGRRPPADDQPLVDPHFAVVLGVDLGDDRCASGGAAADHHEDHLLRRGHARHRRIPVRARHLDPRWRRQRGRRGRAAGNGAGDG